MSSLEMEQSPRDRKLETAFLFTVTAANYWPVGRRHRLDRIKCKGDTETEREKKGGRTQGLRNMADAFDDAETPLDC